MGKKAPKDPNKPKRNLSGYMLFLNDNRQPLRDKYPDESLPQVMRRCGAKWKELTEEERAPYLQKAVSDKTIYLAELEKYKNSPNYLKHEEVLREIQRKKIHKSFKKDPNKPKKYMTGFFQFLKHTRPSIASEGLRSAQIVKKMSDMWKNLSEEDRGEWQNKGVKAKEVYKKVMEEYNKSDEFRSYEQEKEEYLIKQKQEILKMRKKEKEGDLGPEEGENEEQKEKKTSKKKRKKKAPKDPNAPKLHLSAYILYLNDTRGPLRKVYPNETQAQVTKRCRKQWMELSVEMKTPYQKKAMSDKDQYLEQLLKYQTTDNYKNHQEVLKKFNKGEIFENFKFKKQKIVDKVSSELKMEIELEPKREIGDKDVITVGSSSSSSSSSDSSSSIHEEVD